ncbi:MAG: AbrB/MazE/SpoVT family DNA-binding domain-containing protein [Bulleidia sp.]|nr:AbrB/MazE/SpoVT family DNA-binding domain-containing protein [Bulleidia sp.]
MNINMLTVSSKGQVVIPAEIRKQLNITEGTRLASYAYGDTIVMKVVRLPSEEEFEQALSDAQNWAKEAGLTETDVNNAISSVRKKKRNK